MKLDRDEEKNEKLKKTEGRNGLGFEDIKKAIEQQKILHFGPNPSEKYPEQLLLVVEIDQYVYAVPCQMKENGLKLITFYPSRKLQKKYKKGL